MIFLWLQIKTASNVMKRKGFIVMMCAVHSPIAAKKTLCLLIC